MISIEKIDERILVYEKAECNPIYDKIDFNARIKLLKWVRPLIIEDINKIMEVLEVAIDCFPESASLMTGYQVQVKIKAKALLDDWRNGE